ncbi:MAG: hypothetical protein AB8B69_02640 [Chitinophagales bacterium]
MSLQTHRKKLIADINNINDTYVILQVRRFIQELQEENSSQHTWLTLASETTPDFVDLDDLAKQQNYDGNSLSHRLKNVNANIWAGENIAELMKCLQS